MLGSSAADVCEELYADADAWMAATAARYLAKRGERVPCGDGCSHCCYKPTVVHVGELVCTPYSPSGAV